MGGDDPDEEEPPIVRQPYARTTVSRQRRIATLIIFPIILLVLYISAALWQKQSIIQTPPDHVAYAGKSALESVIVLPKIQHHFPNKAVHDERRQQIKEEIKRSWSFYVQQAWGLDEIRPVRGGGRDNRYISHLRC